MSSLVVDRVQICGVFFDDLDADGVVKVVADSLRAGSGGWIVTPNVDILRQLVADPEMSRLVGRASLVIVDGAPVQWAGRIAGHPGVNRAPGASLAVPLARIARDQDRPMLLLGGRPGAGEQAAANLSAAIPGLRVDDHCPDLGFEDDPQRWDAGRAAVRANAGGIVLCGFGYPQQERVMARLVDEFPDTWFLGIGGTIDFLAGMVSRAPEWMQAAGVEWMYRLAVEPRRLARRYLVDGIPFAGRLLVWAAKERQQAAAAERQRRRTLTPAQVSTIDLDRRTIALTPAAEGEAPVELSFTEYLAHEEHDPPTATAEFETVIDLRDGVRPTVSASLTRRGVGSPEEALPGPRAAESSAPASAPEPSRQSAAWDPRP